MPSALFQLLFITAYVMESLENAQCHWNFHDTSLTSFLIQKGVTSDISLEDYMKEVILYLHFSLTVTSVITTNMVKVVLSSSQFICIVVSSCVGASKEPPGI